MYFVFDRRANKLLGEYLKVKATNGSLFLNIAGILKENSKMPRRWWKWFYFFLPSIYTRDVLESEEEKIFLWWRESSAATERARPKPFFAYGIK